jgi:N-acylneuraminate cytidylyltransferase
MDTSPEWLSWQHAVTEAGRLDSRPIDVFVSVPATCPLRAASDIDACVEKLLTTDADIVVTVKQADRNPYFSMVSMDEKGYARLAISGKERVFRRQDAPTVYDLTAVAYATRPSFIMKSGGIFDGKVMAVEIPAERAIDIDTRLDFRIAEILMKDRLEAEGKTV